MRRALEALNAEVRHILTGERRAEKVVPITGARK
jgi:hypothetical protein